MTAAYKRFLGSMNIGYEQWHDGIGYDLDALDEMSPGERRKVEAVLVGRRNNDWRDTEALAHLGSERAVAALKDSLDGPDRTVRLRAAELLRDRGDDPGLEGHIVEVLRNGALGDGLAQAEMLAEQHPTDAVKRALLEGVLCSTDGRAVRFAGLLFYFAGIASEAFDWNHRPFFLRFAGPDRREAFAELCAKIGADPLGVTCP